MGWNSWDSFATTINEEQARANAAVMAERLLPFGYQYFTVDIQWYEPTATGYEYNVGAPLEMDSGAACCQRRTGFRHRSAATLQAIG